MTLKDDLTSAVDAITGRNFTITNGIVVPTTQDVGYDQARQLEATYLYADMVDSSGLVAISPQATVGKVLRMFLDVSVRVIRARGGHIRSFDGDRVMGILVGEDRQDRAAHWAELAKRSGVGDPRQETLMDCILNNSVYSHPSTRSCVRFNFAC